MTMRNADLPAYPVDQRGAHDIGMGQIIGLPEGHPDRERTYIEAVAKAATGLTKREAAAIAAMQGMLANPDAQMVQFDEERIARAAISHADALLRELED